MRRGPAFVKGKWQVPAPSILTTPIVVRETGGNVVIHHARLSGTSLSVLLVVLGLGCAPSRDVALLTLESAGPDRIAAGQEMVVVGQGFPAGRRGTLTFDGEAFVPGRRPHAVHFSKPTTAISATELTLGADDSVFEAVGGRASFRGRIAVSFRARDGGTVSGALDDVALDFLPSTADRLAYELGDAARGRAVALRIGVRIADEEPEEGGLVIARVLPDTAAARVGLRDGDRIVEMDHVRLHTLADLLPPPGIHETELAVLRGDDEIPVIVRLPLFVASDAPSAFILGMSIVLGLSLIVILLATPGARITDLLVEPAPSDPEATLTWLFGAQGMKPRRIRTFFTLIIGISGMSLAFAGIAGITRLLEHGFGAGILLTTALVLRLSARVAGDDVPDEEDKIVGFFAIGTPLALEMTSVSLLVGTGHLSQIEAAQGPMPWQWLVFENPIAFALFPVFAATALGRVEPHGTKSRVAQVVARAHMMVVSALGAFAFLGGASVPDIEGIDPRMLGVAVYVSKCWALIALGLWARSLSRFGGANVWKWAVPASMLGVVASLGWIVARVPGTVESSAGPVLATVSLVMATMIAIIRFRARSPRLVLSPFL